MTSEPSSSRAEDPFPLVSLRRLEALLGVDRATLRSVASTAGRYYHPFDRRKEAGRGKWRHIDNPTTDLKWIQRRIQRGLLSKVALPEQVTGGVSGRSIRTNAAFHVGQPVVVAFDLRDCFPSIDNRAVYLAYRNVFGCSPQIASLLTRLTTFQRRLPQGVPTSTSLANLVLMPMFAEIQRLAANHSLEASFYVDDIALSGPGADNLIEAVIRIIQRHGYAVRARKLLVMRSTDRQQVTGTVVNRRLGIARTTRMDIRQSIYEVAAVPGTPSQKIRSIRGRIAHVKSISPSQGASLQRLADRLLPVAGRGGPVQRVSETRPCTNASRHRRNR